MASAKGGETGSRSLQDESDSDGAGQIRKHGGQVPRQEKATVTTRESAKPTDHAHARTRTRARSRKLIPGRKPKKGERVEYIIREMTSGRWVPGVSHQEVAKKFGVSIATVNNDAAEAHRRIRGLTLGDPELKELCTVWLLKAVHMAQGAKDASRGSEAITKAVNVLAGIHGFEAPKKVGVDATGTLATFLGLGTGDPDAKGEPSTG